MKTNTFSRMTSALLLTVAACSAGGFARTVSARPMIDPAIYRLWGTGPFSTSAATATVTRLSSDRFGLSLTAIHLPPPTILHMKFALHAYVAWLVNGTVMHGPMHMAAVGLTATGRAGNYAGQGIVAISGVTSVIISAEPIARACMPIMPIRTVLASAPHQM